MKTEKYSYTTETDHGRGNLHFVTLSCASNCRLQIFQTRRLPPTHSNRERLPNQRSTAPNDSTSVTQSLRDKVFGVRQNEGEKMTTETVAKKIDELRVADLKVELEARSLDTHGNKIDLLTRLKKVSKSSDDSAER